MRILFYVSPKEYPSKNELSIVSPKEGHVRQCLWEKANEKTELVKKAKDLGIKNIKYICYYPSNRHMDTGENLERGYLIATKNPLLFWKKPIIYYVTID